MNKRVSILAFLLLFAQLCFAQNSAKVNARIDATQITIGDQVRMFIEAQNDSSQGTLQWAAIPDSFNHLEVVEKGKIDTIRQGRVTTYKQRLLITGFDSGLYKIPPFVFSVIPQGGNAYTMATDSFAIMVNTVAVDTTKPFKPIKDIIYVKSTWLDYIWYIVGGLLFVALLVFVVAYFLRNRKAPAPIVEKVPSETLQEKALRLLNELDAQQLWQKNQVKEYYIQLTDIVRGYIEERFHTPALEITTDELLYKTRLHKEMNPFYSMLSNILNTADLAKFAKAQPLPQEHMDAMEQAKQFIIASKPVVVTETPQTQTPS